MTSPWPLQRGACAILFCLLVSGCAVGSSHPSGGSPSSSAAKTSAVALNLIAPTTGATVGVRAIDVVGTVQPATAVVDVAGYPTEVSRGTFKRVLQLSASTTTIQVTAQAPGYAPSKLQTVVRYSPRLAVALVAAHRAVWTMPPPAPAVQAMPRPASAPQTSLRTSGLAAAGSSASVAAAVTGVSGAGSSGSASGSAAASPVSPAPTPSTSPSTSPSSGPTPSPTPAPASGPAPTSNPGTPTAAEIRQAYLDECRKAAGGQPASPYCTCMYNHLLSAGALSGRASIESMERAIKDFDGTHDISKLPAYLRTAQATCVSKMPAPKLPVAGLPRLQHPAVPGPSAG